MITEIRNGHNVKRFHTTERIREETVGHHSAGVASIILRLDPECSKDILVAALMHDVPEAYTGDVPATAKWDHDGLADCLAEMEIAYINGVNIPDVALTVEEMYLLKLADMLDLVLSSLEEMGRGNQYARQLVENGQKAIESMDVSDEIMNQVGLMVMEVKLSCQPTTIK